MKPNLAPPRWTAIRHPTLANSVASCLLLVALGPAVSTAEPPAKVTAPPPPVERLTNDATNRNVQRITRERVIAGMGLEDLHRRVKQWRSTAERVEQAVKRHEPDSRTEGLNLAAEISQAANNYLGEASPLMRAAGKLQAKLAATRQQLLQRALDPELSATTRSLYLKMIQSVADQEERLIAARSAITQLDLELRTLAKGLSDAVDAATCTEGTSQQAEATKALLEIIQRVESLGKCFP